MYINEKKVAIHIYSNICFIIHIMKILKLQIQYIYVSDI